MFRTGMHVGDTVQVGDTVKQVIEVLPGGYILRDLSQAEAAAAEKE